MEELSSLKKGITLGGNIKLRMSRNSESTQYRIPFGLGWLLFLQKWDQETKRGMGGERKGRKEKKEETSMSLVPDSEKRFVIKINEIHWFYVMSRQNFIKG